jgi:hypothetical protein
MKLILTEQQLETMQTMNTKFIVYHGSPTKFSKFLKQESISGQYGADCGYFFTDSKKIASIFAQQQSPKMFVLLKNEKVAIEKKYAPLYDTLIKPYESIIKNFLEDELYEGYKINSYKDELFVLVRFVGRKNLEEPLLQLYSAVKELEKKEKDELQTIAEKLQKTSDFYVYKCQINLVKYKILDGEVVGTTINRACELTNLEDNGFDGVIIKNADTGAGVGTEYVVFDEKNIKIVEVEKLIINH